MRSTRLIYLMAGVAMLMTAQPTGASEPPNAAQGFAKGRANPYSRLFQTPDLTTRQRQPSTASPSPVKPKVVCGMTVIPADPSIDPKIVAGPRRDDTHYTMRIIPPPVCSIKER